MTVRGFLAGVLLGALIVIAADRPEDKRCPKCPAHVPCAVPQWDRDPKTFEEWEDRQKKMREMQEECGHKMSDVRASK